MSATKNHSRERGKLATSLYVHVPYCESACPYCDFAFVVGQDHTADRYLSALKRELADRSSEFSRSPLQTIYFGGGTPSSLHPEQIGRLLRAIEEEIGISSDVEATLEADPLHADHYDGYRALGVNRLSLGIQSFIDRDLRSLGRRHTAAQAIEAIEVARSTGFENINIDLIFGAPEQTLNTWRNTIEHAVSLSPDHMSIYGLTIEPDTPFGRRHSRGSLPVVSDADQAAMYEWTQDRLAREGYEHYEISNYARPGRSSLHNLACWRGAAYVGLGASAHSFDGLRRSWNVRALSDYLEKIESSAGATAGHETLTAEQRQLEGLMLGLRTSDGVHTASVSGATTTVEDLVDHEMLEKTGDRIRLTPRGRVLADAVCGRLAGAL